ncbi:MAG: amino acid adenylation domain-containing protein, partial [Bifidobacteriaceae bacterium]|nr:amino acid adenylation domain-containing protein [Bifidobacteriaceae bacterium]
MSNSTDAPTKTQLNIPLALLEGLAGQAGPMIPSGPDGLPLAALALSAALIQFSQDRTGFTIALTGSGETQAAAVDLDPDQPLGAGLASLAAGLAPIQAGAEPPEAWVTWDQPRPESAVGRLHLDWAVAGDQATVTLTGDDAIYESRQLTVWGWHLAELARSWRASPATPAGRLNLVSQAEWDAIGQVNDTAAPFSPLTIHGRVSQTVRRYPDSIALVDAQGQLTFAEMEAQANRLARRLQGSGIGRGQTVGLMPARGATLVIAMLGVLRSGAAFVPLSPAWPRERVDFVLADSGAAALLVGSPAFDFGPPGLLRVDLTEASTWEADAEPLEEATTPQDLCAVIYTSGTTGLPKGVRVRHDTIVNYGEFNHTEWPIEPSDVITQFAPFTFSTAILEITAPLFSGARLVCVADEVIADPRQFIGAMAANGVTIVLAPPEYARYLVPLPTLRILETGASPCPPELSAKFAGQLLHVNAYGLTEVAVPLVWHGAKDGQVPRRVPIGRPVPNTQVRVMRGDTDCGLYMPGEIRVTGISVSDGYVGHPDLQAERFIPWAGDGLMMRTGDIGWWNADGDIEYLGRADNQIKIRGQRVELEEVERLMASLPYVETAGAIARHEVTTNLTELTGFVVSMAPLDLKRLRQDLAARMTSAMVPSRLVQIETLPLTPNGKPDRKALATLAEEGEPPPEEPSLPSETERLVQQAFQEALGSPVEVTDSFFDRGGHSLTATWVINRLEELTGQRLALLDLFEAPTPAQLAARLTAGAAPAAQIASVGGPGDYPLTATQRRLCVIEGFGNAGVAYNIPALVELSAKADPVRVRQVYAQLVERHEGLRTSFPLVDGEPVQRIEASAPAELAVIDLTGTGPLDAQQAADLVTSFGRPFDLTRAPLARLALVRLSDGPDYILYDIHHLVADGTSIMTLLSEFAALYEGRELEPVLAQAKDYAAYLAAQDTAADQAYWLEQLASPPSPLDWPTDFPRPAVVGFEGDAVTVHLPPAFRQLVGAYAARRGATDFMVLAAVAFALLGRQGRADDIALGTPVAGRTHRAAEHLVGMLVNTLVLRAQPRPDMTFDALVNQVRNATLGALEHQAYPFDELVDQVTTGRDPSRHPLFDVSFALRNFDPARLVRGGSVAREVPVRLPVSKTDLSLTLTPTADGGYDLEVEYRTDLWRRSTAQALAQHFAVLAAHALEAPETELGRLSVLDEAERELVLNEFNRPAAGGVGDGMAADVVSGPDSPPAAPAGHGGTVIGAIAAQVVADPAATALLWRGQPISRGELWRRSSHLAADLRKGGVGRGDRVALLAQRGPEFVVGTVGIMLAGAAFVPLDSAWPAARLQSLVADAAPKALVVYGTAPLTGFGGLVLDLGDPALTAGPAPSVTPVNQPDDPIYCLFTSGTTGQPKAAVMRHRGVLAVCLDRMTWELCAAEPQITGWTVTSTFDMSAHQMLGSLVQGATMALAGPDDVASPGALAAWLSQSGVTSLVEVPAKVAAMLAEAPDCLKALKVLLLGGEVLEPNLARLVLERGPARLCNAYGPTETSIFSSGQWVTDPDDITLGPPMAAALYYVLDGLEPCGVTMPGELCIGGDVVGAGYLGRPELTAQRFVPNPYGPGVLYRTGDLARWLPDGRVDFLGRVDRQIKIRGLRIEPGEIEATIQAVPGMEQAAVVLHRQGADQLLVAYVVGSADEAVVRQHCAEQLPRYMVPNAIVFLERLPVTVRGKLDRAALAARQLPRAQSGGQAPRDALEAAVAGAFAEALGHAVGVEDDFFAAGGHSLRAMRLTARLAQQIDRPVDLLDVFTHPTVAGLAGLLRERTEQATNPIKPAGGPGAYPMAGPQRRLFALDQIDGGAPVYNMPAAARLPGGVDAERLETAFAALVKRHEVLRTGFEVRDGEPFQVVYPPQAVTPKVELLDDAGATLEQVAARFVRPFDLAAPPLVRLGLVSAGLPDGSGVPDGVPVLLFDAHHIVCDGWTMRRLVVELAALYEGTELPPVAVHYKDWSQHQAGLDLSAAADYWLEQFADGGPKAGLVTDWPRPAQQDFAGATITTTLDMGTRRRLGEAAAAGGATEYMVALAAWAALLARYTRSEDVAVGTAVAGRTTAGAQDVVGMLVATLALRLRPEGGLTFAGLVEQVREVVLAAQRYQDYPFEDLVAALGPAVRDTARNPLFDTMFVFEADPPLSFVLDGQPAQPLALTQPIAKFDLSLTMLGRGDGYELGLEYATSLFGPVTAARLLHHYQVLLQAALANPDATLAELSEVDAAERSQLLEELAPGPKGPPETTLAALFGAQVAARPEATAVVADDATLTYGELDTWAAAFAAALGEVGAGDRVGIALPRSACQVAAILGVVKTGAAWLPLEPSLPAARLADLVSDAQPVAVIGDAAGPVRPLPGGRLIDAFTVARTGRFVERELDPAADLYCLYTSGTTGRPKGVVVTNRGLAALHQTHRDWLGVGPQDTVLGYASPAFDASVWELVMALTNGATLRLVPPGRTADLAWLNQCLAAGVTVATLPPAILTRLDVAPLRLVISAGSGAHPVDRLGGQFVNAYGPTETTVCTTLWRRPEADSAWPVRIPIGRPLPGTTVYVVDQDLRLTGLGRPGELLAAGPSLARCYHGQPELTGQTFVTNPFGPGRVYRTGDLVRWNQAGELEFLGRVDRQLKINGVRVEPGQVEAMLRQQPDVEDAYVTGVAADGAPPALVAYVVGAPDLEPLALRTALAGELPAAEVPSAIVVLDALPLNASGKVDEAALPRPGRAEATANGELEGPAEVAVAQAFAAALELDAVGPESDFFALGGDSIAAISVVGAVRQAGYEVSVGQVLSARTVRALAALAKATGPAGFDMAVASGPEFALTPIQQRFFAHQMPQPNHFNQHVWLTGAFDPAALRAALAAVVERHDLLRAGFTPAGGRIEPAGSVELPLTVLEPGASQDQVAQAAARLQGSLDLTCPPLLAALLVPGGARSAAGELAADEPEGSETAAAGPDALLMVAHHLVVDAISWRVLGEDLDLAYRQAAKGRDPVLGTGTAAFGVWTARLEAAAAAGEFEPEVKYWVDL